MNVGLREIGIFILFLIALVLAYKLGMALITEV